MRSRTSVVTIHPTIQEEEEEVERRARSSECGSPHRSFMENAWNHLLYIYSDFLDFFLMLHESGLSWRDDFFFFHAMSIPKVSEVFMRFNLNVPYYIYNYIQIMIVVTVPMLLCYNLLFLVVLAANCVVIDALAEGKLKKSPGNTGVVQLLGYDVRVSHFGHFFLLLWLIVFLFFNGCKTACYLFLLNFLVVVPHALLRTPTLFDDEEMEKLRPKLINYVLMAVLLFLVYLEGDIDGPEEENLRRSAEEREKIQRILLAEAPLLS